MKKNKKGHPTESRHTTQKTKHILKNRNTPIQRSKLIRLYRLGMNIIKIFKQARLSKLGGVQAIDVSHPNRTSESCTILKEWYHPHFSLYFQYQIMVHVCCFNRSSV